MRSGVCHFPMNKCPLSDRFAVEPGLVSPTALHKALFKLAEEKLSRGNACKIYSVLTNHFFAKHDAVNHTFATAICTQHCWRGNY